MIAVFGGRGFIGGELVSMLARGHEDVVVIDNDTFLHSDGRTETSRSARVENVSGDVRDGLRMEEVFLKYPITKVVLLVANLDVQFGERNAVYDVERGVVSGVRLLELCVRYGVKKVVFASSSGVYAQDAEMPTGEEGKLGPVSVYHAGKLAMEVYLDYFYRIRKLPYVAVRFGKVYGPRKLEAITTFSERMLRGEELVLHGTGETTRDLLYVTDAAEILRLGLERDFVGKVNAASGRETSLLQIVSALESICSKKVKVVFKDLGCHQDRMFLDISKARKELGWSPKVSLVDGIKNVVEWVKGRITT